MFLALLSRTFVSSTISPVGQNEFSDALPFLMSMCPIARVRAIAQGRVSLFVEPRKPKKLPTHGIKLAIIGPVRKTPDTVPLGYAALPGALVPLFAIGMKPSPRSMPLTILPIAKIPRAACARGGRGAWSKKWSKNPSLRFLLWDHNWCGIF